ncbi:MAG: DUF4410 domain-containing protein [Victivallaceae bacterium]|jgi:hypothetical protein
MNYNTLHSVTKPAASSLRKSLPVLAASLVSLVLAAGCASTEFTSRERLVTEKLPRPAKIVIYDFVANPADVPQDSSVAGQTAEKAAPPTAEEIKAGQQLGAGIAAQLVQQICDMGLPAEKGSPKTKLQVNDIILRGYLVSVSQGDSTKRVVVGFGYGASELETLVEGYQMTAKGLRKLGSGKVKSVGSKSPGGAVGAVSMIANANPAGLIVGGVVKGYGEISGNSKVEGLAKSTAKVIADQLQTRFKEEDWIK